MKSKIIIFLVLVSVAVISIIAGFSKDYISCEKTVGKLGNMSCSVYSKNTLLNTQGHTDLKVIPPSAELICEPYKDVQKKSDGSTEIKSGYHLKTTFGNNIIYSYLSRSACEIDKNQLVKFADYKNTEKTIEIPLTENYTRFVICEGLGIAAALLAIITLFAKVQNIEDISPEEKREMEKMSQDFYNKYGNKISSSMENLKNLDNNISNTINKINNVTDKFHIDIKKDD